MAIIREISDSNLETGRNGSKSGVSRIIRESWQPCVYSQTLFFGQLLNKDTSLLQTVCFVPGERKSLSYPYESYIFSEFNPVDMDTPQSMC